MMVSEVKTGLVYTDTKGVVLILVLVDDGLGARATGHVECNLGS